MLTKMENIEYPKNLLFPFWHVASSNGILGNLLKVALQILDEKYKKNILILPKPFEFHTQNPGSQKTSDNQRS